MTAISALKQPLDDVGGWVLTRNIERTFENSARIHGGDYRSGPR
jgi:hypothetical protein